MNHAISRMDRATQQNIALVEQSVAASQSLDQQAHELQDLMVLFKLA